MLSYSLPNLRAPRSLAGLEVDRRIAEHGKRVAREERALRHRTRQQWLEEPISELPSPVTPFIVAALEKARVLMVRDLLSKSVAELLLIKNIGRKSVLALLASLAQAGWTKQATDVFSPGRCNTPISATFCRSLAAQVGRDHSDDLTGVAAGPRIRVTIPECAPECFGAVKDEAA